MKSRASDKFWILYGRLSPETQRLADRNYRIWVANHWHPSLHLLRDGG